MSSINLPLISIPAYYVLTTLPRLPAAALEVRNLKPRDNANPKGSEFREQLKAKLSPELFAKWERCENCHRNGLENMPLYCAAIFAGLYAQQKSGRDLNVTWTAGAWMLIRILYTLNYIYTTSQEWSYVRSLLYHAGGIVCYSLFIRSAKAAGPA